jgi:hypothetical protein
MHKQDKRSVLASLRSGSQVRLQFFHRTVTGLSSLGLGKKGDPFFAHGFYGMAFC